MQLILNNQNYNIQNFTIYGERHSGTKLLSELIQKNLKLPITWDYGWKHWFGFCDHKILKQADKTLFIGIVRNPYDWIMAMSKIPYHIPKNNCNNIHALLHNEWYSIDDYNKEILHDRNYIDGCRYKNIFEMRYVKNNYLINYMPFLVNKYILITYENLIYDMNNFIENISRLYRLYRHKHYIPNTKDTGYLVQKNILDTINSNINWSIENRFGYYVYQN